MKHFRESKRYEVKMSLYREYLRRFWFIPSDVLQRSIESNIWHLAQFESPVLEIGTGDGEISAEIFKAHLPLDVGIDINQKEIEKAKKTKVYKKVMCANAEKMPFQDNSFKTIVSNSSFEHITHDLIAVSEVSRVLKPKGLFFLTVPSNYLSQWILEYEQEKNKEKAKTSLDQFNNRANHRHYRSVKEWKKQFEKNQMELIFYKHYFPKPVALFWYKLFKLSTFSVKNRELWSYIGHSKFSKVVPKKVIIKVLEDRVLKNKVKDGFFTEQEGAQLFMIAQKVSS